MEPSPWGRPGPGGTPWRDPKNIGQNFMQSMGWTTKDQLRSINNDMNAKHVDASKVKQPIQSTKMTCCDRCSCQCIKQIENSILRSNSPPKRRAMEVEEQPQERSPRKIPHYAMPQQCNRHSDELQQQQQLSSKPKPKLSPQKKQSRTSLIAGGGVELVPLLAKRRDERPISLSTTDITKYKINKSR